MHLLTKTALLESCNKSTSNDQLEEKQDTLHGPQVIGKILMRYEVTFADTNAFKIFFNDQWIDLRFL